MSVDQIEVRVAASLTSCQCILLLNEDSKIATNQMNYDFFFAILLFKNKTRTTEMFSRYGYFQLKLRPP